MTGVCIFEVESLMEGSHSAYVSRKTEYDGFCIGPNHMHGYLPEMFLVEWRSKEIRDTEESPSVDRVVVLIAGVASTRRRQTNADGRKI